MSTDARAGPGRAGIPWPSLVALALPLVGLACCSRSPSSTCSGSTTRATSGSSSSPPAVNVVLAYVTNVAAGRYRDARLVLISLAFLASAGFLGLHALATPGVLLPTPNAGFVIATPVGLVIASVFAAASTSRSRARGPGSSCACGRSCWRPRSG